MLAAVGKQLAGAGLSELAGRCANVLAEFAADDAEAELELAALLRALGDEARAYTLETTLLKGRRLAIRELPRVLQLVKEAEGAEAAFAAGEQALVYTADSAFLEAMIGLAEDVGQPERAAGWRETLQEREQAKQEQQKERASSVPAPRGAAGKR